MSKLRQITLLILMCIGVTARAQKMVNDTSGRYRLVWADEFNKNGSPDSTNWKFEQGFTRNNEAQWYQENNAVCSNGSLIITAKKVHLPNPRYIAGSNSWKTNRQFIDYTSSSLNTSGLHAWKYGRMVMRARVDTDAGLWPAFWTLGVDKPWPSNGEIDIMEYYRNMLLANIACGTDVPYKAKWFSKTKQLNTFGVGWSKKFHIWRMDWDEKSISLFVDNQLMNRVELKDLVNVDGTNFNPFTQPHYILLNLAVGGDNGGDPSATSFPKRFEIDYVRVYQQNKGS